MPQDHLVKDVQDAMEHPRGTSSQRTNSKKDVFLGPKHLLFLEVKSSSLGWATSQAKEVVKSKIINSCQGI